MFVKKIQQIFSKPVNTEDMTKDLLPEPIAKPMIAPKPEPENPWPAKVARIQRPDLIVINRGSIHGLYIGFKVFIYVTEEEVFDPDTNESLGQVPAIKGSGQIIQVQPKLSVIQSLEKMKEHEPDRSNRQMTREFFFITTSTIIPPADGRPPFEGVKIGDFVSPL